MIFSNKELTAVLSIAYGMAEIDGRTDDIETEAIYSYMTSTLGVQYDKLFDLSRDAIVYMEPKNAMRIINDMTLIQKQHVQALLIIIMAADGEIDENEMIMLRVITMVCGLPPINNNDIRTALVQFRSMKLI